MPTFYEKLIWASGDGDGLRVLDTPIGKIGMLICGENTNPLARYALIAQGEQVHVSSYPPVWPTRPSNQPGRYDLAAAIEDSRRRALVRRQGLQHRVVGISRPIARSMRCAASAAKRAKSSSKPRGPYRW